MSNFFKKNCDLFVSFFFFFFFFFSFAVFPNPITIDVQKKKKQQLGQSEKYAILYCIKTNQLYRFGTTRGWINDRNLYTHRIASTRAKHSSTAATAATMRAGVGRGCWVTSGRRKQATERARRTQQHRSMSRNELNVGLANVWTGACVLTWQQPGRKPQNY